ncbi:hypothetical protein ACN6KF_001497 [Labrys sp. La1]|uniref:hypothetical protein n=1 Tax=Labrys sp. La1 TaxID=3404917 RepID=UPI003EBEEF62
MQGVTVLPDGRHSMQSASLDRSGMSHLQNSSHGNINSLFGICSGPELRDRVTAHLRKIYPNKPAEHVAAATDLPVDTVRKWFARQNTPNGPAIVRLVFVYGIDFLCSIMDEPPRWLDRAAQAEEKAAIDADLEALLKRREALR